MWGFDRIFAGALEISYWHGIEGALSNAGYRAIPTRVHPSAGIAERAGELKKFILNRLEGENEKAVIIAHAIGGMDARYMISNLGMSERISALVMIGTGHAGSAYYEWAVRILDLFGALSFINSNLFNLAALWETFPERCRELSGSCPDMPGVRYFSVSGVCAPWHMPAPMWPGYAVLALLEGSNDGRVSRKSSLHGENLGIWPVNHFHLVNWPWTRFSAEDVIPRYLSIMEMLRREGLV